MARNTERPTHTSRNLGQEDVDPRESSLWYKRLSWGAILAGVLVSLVSMLVLNLLGIGIGLASIDPMTETNTMQGIGTGAIIWWIVSNLIAIFAGAYIAARVAGIPLASISMIHGVLSWCAFTLISFWLLTTTVGSIISGVGTVISQTLSTVGSGVEAIVDGSNPQNQAGDQNQGNNINLAKITTEVSQILRQTDDPALQPDSVRQMAQENIDEIRQTLRNEENISQQDIEAMVQQLVQETQNLTQEIDRDDVVSVVAARTDLSESTVSNIADVIYRNVEEAQIQIQRLQARAKQQAEEAAAETAEAASSAAIWSFVALLLGAGCAVAGGRAGRPTSELRQQRKRETVNY